jgi:acetyl-CoA carboxylase biotin carboxylase subunit
MVGKLIVHRPSRKLAITTARRALEEIVLEGIRTTIPLHLRILEHSDFINGDVDTGFIDRYFGPR